MHPVTASLNDNMLVIELDKSSRRESNNTTMEIRDSYVLPQKVFNILDETHGETMHSLN